MSSIGLNTSIDDESRTVRRKHSTVMQVAPQILHDQIGILG